MKFSRILSYVKTFFITLLRGGPTPSDPVPVPVPVPDPELSLADLLDAVTDIKQQLLKLSRDLIDEAVIALLERYEGLALSVLRLSREAAKMQGVLSACKEDMTSLVETTERYFSALETFGLHFAKTKTASLSTRIREDNNLNCLVDWLDNLSTDLQKALNANRDFDLVYQRLQATCLISLHKCTALRDEAVEREAQVKRYGRGWVLLAVVTVVSPILGVLSIAKAAIGGVAAALVAGAHALAALHLAELCKLFTALGDQFTVLHRAAGELSGILLGLDPVVTRCRNLVANMIPTVTTTHRMSEMNADERMRLCENLIDLGLSGESFSMRIGRARRRVREAVDEVERAIASSQ